MHVHNNSKKEKKVIVTLETMSELTLWNWNNTTVYSCYMRFWAKTSHDIQVNKDEN